MVHIISWSFLSLIIYKVGFEFFFDSNFDLIAALIMSILCSLFIFYLYIYIGTAYGVYQARYLTRNNNKLNFLFSIFAKISMVLIFNITACKIILYGFSKNLDNRYFSGIIFYIDSSEKLKNYLIFSLIISFPILLSIIYALRHINKTNLNNPDIARESLDNNDIKMQKLIKHTANQMFDKLFPKGESDIIADVNRISIITEGAIPQSEITDFVIQSKTLIAVDSELSINKYDDDDFIASIKIKSLSRINDKQARNIYVYLAGESLLKAKYNRLLRESNSHSNDDFEKFIAYASHAWEVGTEDDFIKEGYGSFGFSPTNPIPTVCVSGSEKYLSKLRLNGNPVNWVRVGSTESSVTKGKIDIYELNDAITFNAIIYICPYHRKNSKLPPAGFKLT